MNIDQILTGLFSVLGTGAVGAVVVALVNRKKTKVETESYSIENAVKIERIAMDRYIEANAKLHKVEKILAEVKKELRWSKEYIDILVALLRKHGIEVPNIEAPEIDVPEI
jgi:homoserine dehydrogenase